MTGFESRSNGLDFPKRYPAAGAVVARSRGGNRPGLPPYVASPYASAFGHRPGYHGAAYLGRQFDPLETVHEPHLRGFRVPNLSLLPELNLQRLDDRRGLLAGLDRCRRQLLDERAAETLGAFHDQAIEFLHNPIAARAFDLESEPAAMRNRYGRHLYGQSALLARRLVEAGVMFVTIHTGGLCGWDHHYKIKDGLGYQAPATDQAVAALIEDLRFTRYARRNARLVHELGNDLSSSFVDYSERPIPIANDGQVIPGLTAESNLFGIEPVSC